MINRDPGELLRLLCSSRFQFSRLDETCLMRLVASLPCGKISLLASFHAPQPFPLHLRQLYGNHLLGPKAVELFDKKVVVLAQCAQLLDTVRLCPFDRTLLRTTSFHQIQVALVLKVQARPVLVGESQLQ
eukprot:CAMPEP_0194546260 /NCGR_PEP_ID=MMETSP0253-20130528/90410_1 /TAXON_ID=2966 /ORGANISM="Noctiluca scintillans" /LENGTH=129 /DNA_ID=CAMNT_0039393335 /DNA_START=45 /DNA_END=434 /DNA_ORIENTATION=+